MMNGIYSINFGDEKLQSEDRIFSDIHLYDELKLLLSRMLVSKESVHCVLVGPLHLERQRFYFLFRKS
jgi:hypothetical protein